MKDWVLANMDGLFSGIGVVLMASVFGLVRRVMRKKPLPESGQISQPKPSTTVMGDNAKAGRDVISAKDGGTANIFNNSQVTFPREATEKSSSETIKKMRDDYLQWVIKDAEVLALDGIDPKAAGSGMGSAQLNLCKIYTALLTRDNLEEGREHLSKEIESKRLVSALEVIDAHSHVVLLGDPGSGKTTFVNFLACCMAGELIGSDTLNLDLLTRPLPDDEGGEGEQRQTWGRGRLIPLRVVLRTFAAQKLIGEKVGVSDFWDFVRDEISKQQGVEYGKYIKKEILENGGIILLDGLDEVPDAENKRGMIRQMVEDLIKGIRNCRVVVTSRTYAYQRQEWRIHGLYEAVLAPFSTGQINRFIDQWYDQTARIRHKNIEDARGNAGLLKQAVFGNERLLSLAGRPLILTLMASLHAWRGGTLPNNREELYNDTVDLLLDQWEQPKMVKGKDGKPVLAQPGLLEWMKIDRAEMRELLNRLAFEAHAGQGSLTGTADIPEKELIYGLHRLCKRTGADHDDLIGFIRDRSGLLLPRGIKVYSFPHRSFQEYLAACHLTDEDYPDFIADLARRDPDRWREVCLLAGAKAGRGSKSTIWQLAKALCYRDTGEATFCEEDVWGALFSGQLLAETGVGPNPAPRYERTLKRIIDGLIHIMNSSVLPALERVNAGNALAGIGDLRFDEKAWNLPMDENWGFVRIPGNTFTMGSDKADDPVAYDDESPRHSVALSEYRISKYPVTVDQYRFFLEDTGKTPGEAWKQSNRVGNHPVVQVSWDDAAAYCTWLSEKFNNHSDLPAGLTAWKAAHGLTVSLPTEAQWEMAARGDDGRIYPCGDELGRETANYGETGIGSISPVGCFPNDISFYGLMDMSGNVAEWCLDGQRKYTKETVENPIGSMDKGADRVFRGGSWSNSARLCRAARRYALEPGLRSLSLGFRLALPGQQR